MNPNLKASVERQLGSLMMTVVEQAAAIGELRAMVAARDAKITELEAKAAQYELPIGDERAGHEGEANGIAH